MNTGHSTPVLTSLHVLWHFRRRGGATFAMLLAFVVAGLLVWPRKYTSEAKLLVRVGRASATLDPTVTSTGQVIGVESPRENEINSVLEVVKSRVILERLLQKVGYEGPLDEPIQREKALIAFSKDIEAWSPKRTNVISIAYDARTPQRAQSVVDALVRIFLDEHVRVNSTPRSVQFFEEQAAGIKRQLDDAVEKLKTVKDGYSLASIQGRRQILERQLGEVEQQAINVVIDLSASEAKIASMQNELKELPAPVVKQFVRGLPASATNNMRQELFRLETREQELLAKYTAAHPAVVALQEQVLRAKEILGAEQPDRGQATSAVLLTEQALESGLVARRRAIESEHQNLTRQLHSLNAQEVQVNNLQREVEILEAKYRTHVQSTEQARIERELQLQAISNISVIQPACLNVKPTSPKKGLTLVIGFGLACVGALGVVALSHHAIEPSR